MAVKILTDDDLYTAMGEYQTANMSGDKQEIVVDENGTTKYKAIILPPDDPWQDPNTNPGAIQGDVKPMSVPDYAGRVSDVFTGIGQGALQVTKGIPGDIVGLIDGIYSAISAPEGKSLDAFLERVSYQSSQLGSEYFLKQYYSDLEQSDLSPETKQAMKDGSKYLGEWAEIPGGMALITRAAKVAKRGSQLAGEIIDTTGGPTSRQLKTHTGADAEAGPTALKQEFDQIMDSGNYSVDELKNTPYVQQTVDRMTTKPETVQNPNYGTPEYAANREFVGGDGSKIQGVEGAVEYLMQHSKTFAWTDDKIANIPANPVKYEKQAIIIIGPPAAGKSTLANPIARSINAAIIDADEAKKIIPEYQGGFGSNVVHEESSAINKMVEEAMTDIGANVVIPKVGANAEKMARDIQALKEKGYTVKLVDMAVDPTEALKRMYSRFKNTDRLIPPSIADVGLRPSNTYDILKSQGVADAYTRIDNNPAIGEPRIVIEDDAGIIQKAGIDHRRLDSNGRQSGNAGEIPVLPGHPKANKGSPALTTKKSKRTAK